MPFKFNPVTGKLDFYESTSKREVIESILTEVDEVPVIPQTEILFDENGILFNDDYEDV